MPLASRRARRSSIDIWPGFVDALAQLLMVIIFMLLVFTVGQFLLSDGLSGRDKALQELQQQVSELSSLLALERSAAENLRAEATAVSSRLQATLADRDAAQAQLARLVEKTPRELARLVDLFGPRLDHLVREPADVLAQQLLLFGELDLHARS